MASYQKYMPGAYWTQQTYVGSVASHSNSTAVVMRAPHKGTLLAAYFIPEASINSAGTGTKYRYYSIVNGGSAGTATTQLAVNGGTASMAAFVPYSMTTQASCSFSASDVVLFQTASASVSNVQTQPGTLQIDWRFER